MANIVEDLRPGVAPVEPAPVAAERGRRRVRKVWYGIAVLAVLTAYFALSGSTYLFTFNLCMIAVIGALALNLLMGTAGMVSIGNSAFMAVGAFVSVYALRSSVPFPLDLLVGAIGAGIAGIVIGLPALRLRGLHLFLATMAGFFVVIHFANEYQSHAKGGSTLGFFYTPLFSSKGIDGGQEYWAWTLLVVVALALLGATRLANERSGRAWRMIRDHETVAHTMGIPVVRYKMLAFGLTSAVIGFQGALLAHFTGSVSAETYTFELAISYVAMVLIGGIDSIIGAVVGAGLVTALPILVPKMVGGVLGAEKATAKGPALATIIYGLLVIVFITSSPQGIVGLSRNIRNRFRRSR